MIRDLGIGVTLILAGLLLALILTIPAPAADRICGKASWYGNEHHGRRTASGEIFDQWAMTAAMPSRSHIGERWRVTYRGKSVVVRINDYGPARYLGRVVDLSRGAASKLGLIRAGVGYVCLERV